MEHKHTPGPWFENGVTVMTGQTSLAHVLNPYKGVVRARDRVEANARLMAAAPELLEALQDMLVLQAGISADPQDTLQRARAAIEKAIGAQQ